MRHLLAAILAVLTVTAAGAALPERSCGLWLNDIPAVADTVAHRLYFTLPASQPLSVDGVLRWDTQRYSGVALNGTPLAAPADFAVADRTVRGAYTLTVNNLSGTTTDWAIEFTTLPLVLVEADQDYLFEIWKTDDEYKSPTYVTVIDANCRTFESHEDDGVDINSDPVTVFTSRAAIRVRGATSAGKEKKPFALELRDDDGNELNMHLLGYRNDGDWILDAMFNDRLRMRNRLITDLWNSVQDLPYAKDNDYQRNGTDGEFVELFMRGRYWGLYCFTDKIDRKKLNLKKTKNEDTATEQTRGMLWKSLFRCDATTFTDYHSDPRTGALTWETSDATVTFEQKYPDTRPDQGDFSPIARMIDRVGINASDDTFAGAWDECFYPDNLIDYHIFTQALQLMDNVQKNMYLSVVNATKGSVLLITPWDLDASLGRDAGGDAMTEEVDKWYAFGEQLGGINYLFHRLDRSPVAKSYRDRFYDRWCVLRDGPLSIDTIRSRMEAYAASLTSSGAYSREYEIWGRKMEADLYTELDFVTDFLRKNYRVFDTEMARRGYGTMPDPDLPDTDDPDAVVISDVASLPAGVGYALKVSLVDDAPLYFMFASLPTATFDGDVMHLLTDTADMEWEIDGVESLSFVYVDNPSSAAPVAVAESFDGPTRLYTLAGVEVSPANLAPGVYILRAGSKTLKFIKR